MLSRSDVSKLRRAQLAGRNKLRAARELAGLTQVQASGGIGITQSYLSSIENGHYGPDGLPLETTRQLATFYGCAVDILFPFERSQQEVA